MGLRDGRGAMELIELTSDATWLNIAALSAFLNSSIVLKFLKYPRHSAEPCDGLHAKAHHQQTTSTQLIQHKTAHSLRLLLKRIHPHRQITPQPNLIPRLAIDHAPPCCVTAIDLDRVFGESEDVDFEPGEFVPE